MESVQEGELLVEIRPQEDLSSRVQVRPDRILVPIGLEPGSAAALRHASGLALEFGSELVLFYAFDDPECRNASRVEGQLRNLFSAVRVRHRRVRLFLRAGVVCEQVKAVASAVGAGLIVVSRDYYRRFLSWLAREEAGVLAIPGIPCPVALVDSTNSGAEGLGAEVIVAPVGSEVLAAATMPKVPPRPMARHALWSSATRARSRGLHGRLNRGRFRGHHAFAPTD